MKRIIFLLAILVCVSVRASDPSSWESTPAPDLNLRSAVPLEGKYGLAGVSPTDAKRARTAPVRKTDASQLALSTEPVEDMAFARSLSSLAALTTPTPIIAGNEADELSAEVTNLARSLQYSPMRLFEHVYNAIDYEHYYGSKKGARLTLLEGSGNDFDQAALLAALFRASGISASYVTQWQVIPFDNVVSPGSLYTGVSWLGLDSNPFPGQAVPPPASRDSQTAAWSDLDYKKGSLLLNYFNSAGFRCFYYSAFPGHIVAPRTIIRATVGGVSYDFDPSAKTYSRPAAMDFTAATGFTATQKTTLLSNVGGTTTSNYTSGLSLNAIKTQHTAATTNLLDAIRTNNFASTSQEIMGQGESEMLEFTNLGSYYSFNYFSSGTLSDGTSIAPQVFTAISTSLMSSIEFQIGTATTYVLTMPKLQGKRVSIFSNATTAAVRLDDIALTTTTVAATYNIRIKAKHPHFNYAIVGNPPTHDQQVTSVYTRGANYAIIYGFAPGRRYLLSRERALEDLVDYVKVNYPSAIDASGAVVVGSITDATTKHNFASELLNAQGVNWLYQTYRVGQITAGLNAQKSVTFHAIGRMAKEGGLYVDVPLMFDSPFAKNGLETNTFNYGLTKAFLFSALEHSIIDQYNTTADTAVSTVQVMHLANISTDPNKNRIYLATSANWSAVQADLLGYTSTQLTDFQTKLNGGSALLLPRNAANTQSGWNWSGGGFVEYRNLPADRSVAMIISGNYAGGYSGVSIPTFTSFSVSAAASASVGSTYSGSPFSVSFHSAPSNSFVPVFGLDPVDMASGAMVHDHEDLSLGAANTRGLSFARHYSSNLHSRADAKLGYGWTHNYNMKAVVRTGNEAGLGETTPSEAAQIIAAAVIINDLVKDTTSVKSMATAILLAKISVDQLLNNAVSLSVGKNSVQFVKQPDGTYTAPAGSTMTLVKSGSNYIATERLGNTFTFDTTQSGRVVEVRDYFGKALTFAYNANGLSTVTDAYARTLTLTYVSGRIQTVTDSTGRSVQFAYNAAGQLVGNTDPEGKASTYEYDAGHRLTKFKDPQNRTIVVSRYDSEGRVYEQDSMGDSSQTWSTGFNGLRSWECDPLGNTNVYYYDKRGRVLVQKDALGNRSQFIYDGQNRIIAKSTPKGEIFSSEYDANHNLKKEAGPQSAYYGPGIYAYNGSISYKDYSYDATNRLTRVDASASDVAAHRIAMLDYDAGNTSNQPNKLTDPKGNVSRKTYYADGNLATVTQESSTGNRTTSYAYDVKGMPQTVTYPDTKTATTVYSARGDLLSQTDRRGKTTTATYNNRREVLTTTEPGNLVTTRTYDDSANLATVVDPMSRVFRFTYSATGKKLTQTSAYGTPEAETTTFVYNVSDWLDYTFDPRGDITELGHDAAGRITSITDPLNRTVTYAYDANGQRTSTQTPLGYTTTTTYTSLGMPDIVTDPALKTYDNNYNGFGERTTLRNRRNQTFQFGYDLNGQPTTVKTPLNFTTTKIWNDRNLLGSVAEPSTQTTSFEYDDLGRAWRVTDPTGQITTAYDDNGNPLTVTEGTAVLTRSFDDLNRPLTYVNARGESLGYTYYPNGLLWRVTYPGARDVTYDYYATNRLKTVTDWAGRVTTYTWDTAGRLTGLQRPNGVRLTQVFDDANRLESIYERNAAGDLLLYVKYAYDADGLLVNRYRLPQPQGVGIPLVSASFDADNRVQTWASVAVTHDADGNMTSGPFFSAGFAPYVYDSRNRLTTVGTAGGGYTSFGYDAENNRIAQTDAGGTTRYLIDSHGGGLPRMAVREKPSGAKTSYVYGLGLLYEVNDTTGDATYYHFDSLGSTGALTGATGAVKDRMEYGPYGQISYRTGTTDTPFLYVGQAGVQTDATKLLYMRARYYSPELMRFLNADPIGFAGGMNWYAYANGNPVMFSDPSGFFPTSSSGLGIAGIGYGMTAQQQYQMAQAQAAQAQAQLDIARPIINALPHSAGVGAGGSATIAPMAVGAHGEGAGGIGVFTTNRADVSVGVFEAHGVSAGPLGVASPQNGNELGFNPAAGLYAGGGAFAWASNAQTAGDLSRTVRTYALNVGFGIDVGVSLSVGNGIWQLGGSIPGAGLSLGIEATGQKTTTNASTLFNSGSLLGSSSGGGGGCRR